MRKKVAIIGCGPVGMLGSLLLQHYGIEYVTFQKFVGPRSHPSAHWLSANSKSIFGQIPGLVGRIEDCQENWENFRYYRYCQNIFGYEIANTDHFRPDINGQLLKTREIFGVGPNHIPQNVLLEKMYEGVKNKDNLQFDTQIKEIKIEQNESGRGYVLLNQKNQVSVIAENVIICSGVGTNLRNKMPYSLSNFHMQGNSNLMDVINIHFRSRNLGMRLKESNKNAMLHFIYGNRIVGILVNHSIDNSGTFVFQIPNYEPFVNLMEIYSARELISFIFENGGQFQDVVRDLEIVHVGKWKIQGLLAKSMCQDGIFLAGDSAHAYPPAGGFGMNSGFQDINQLIHGLKLCEKNPKINVKNVHEKYNINRRKINFEYLKKALQNYEITREISKNLGYPPNILDYFSKGSLIGTLSSFLPKVPAKTMEIMRLKAMQFMYKRQILLNPGLNLFFDEFERDILQFSSIRPLIMKENQLLGANAPQIYACKQQISYEKIAEIVGNVEESNIRFFSRSEAGFANAQKIISSDGNIILK